MSLGTDFKFSIVERGSPQKSKEPPSVSKKDARRRSFEGGGLIFWTKGIRSAWAARQGKNLHILKAPKKEGSIESSHLTKKGGRRGKKEKHKECS